MPLRDGVIYAVCVYLQNQVTCLTFVLLRDVYKFRPHKSVIWLGQVRSVYCHTPCDSLNIQTAE